MEKLTVRRQIVGPLLREPGEAFGPNQRRHAHSPANRIVSPQHRVRDRLGVECSGDQNE